MSTYCQENVHLNPLKDIHYKGYKKPIKYKAIRVYDWGYCRNTIIKNLEISNKNEFASLASFSIYDKSKEKLTSTAIIFSPESIN